MSDKKLKVFKTYRIKVKGLNKNKVAVIDKKIKLATNVYFQMIDSVRDLAIFTDEYINQFKTDDKEKLKELKLMQKSVLDEIKKTLSLNFRNNSLSTAIVDGIIEDVTSQISSTIELKKSGQIATLPLLVDIDDYISECYELLKSSTTKNDEDRARDMLSRVKKPVKRPLHFTRSRDFRIFITENNNLFTVLPLFKKGAGYKIANTATNIATGEIEKINTSIAMKLMLDASDWQKENLLKGTIKTANLVKHNDDLYMHIAVQFLVDAREPQYEGEAELGRADSGRLICGFFS